MPVTTYSQTSDDRELVATCEKPSNTSWGIFRDVKRVDGRSDTDSDTSDESIACQPRSKRPEEFSLPSDIHGGQVTAGSSLHGNTDKYQDRCSHERQSSADIVGQPHGDETTEEGSSLDSRDDI